MDLPIFDPNQKSLLFFSRGRGRGHAIPDAAIFEEISRLRDDVDIRFVSYGTGAATLQEFGLPLIDLQVGDFCPAPPIQVAAAKLIGCMRPDLVVSHEEFGVLPMAKVYEKPALYITDWFEAEQSFSSECLLFASEILFIDAEGVFAEPTWVQGKVRYVGPVLRDLHYRADDRERARAEAGISPETLLVLAAPGSWSEQAVPTLDLLLGALDRVAAPSKRLLWLAGNDAEHLRSRLGGRKDVTVLDFDPLVERWLVAADHIVTKGSRKTLQEVEFLGLEATALIRRSSPLNPIDLRFADALGNVEVLDPDAADALDHLIRRLSGPARRPAKARAHLASSGKTAVAQRISQWLDGKGC